MSCQMIGFDLDYRLFEARYRSIISFKSLKNGNQFSNHEKAVYSVCGAGNFKPAAGIGK